MSSERTEQNAGKSQKSCNIQCQAVVHEKKVTCGIFRQISQSLHGPGSHPPPPPRESRRSSPSRDEAREFDTRFRSDHEPLAGGRNICANPPHAGPAAGSSSVLKFQPVFYLRLTPSGEAIPQVRTRISKIHRKHSPGVRLLETPRVARRPPEFQQAAPLSRLPESF